MADRLGRKELMADSVWQEREALFVKGISQARKTTARERRETSDEPRSRLHDWPGWAFDRGRSLGRDGSIHVHGLVDTALEDNLADVIEALNMFVGGPWICCDRTDAMVGLSHDIEGNRPVLSDTEIFSRHVCQFA